MRDCSLGTLTFHKCMNKLEKGILCGKSERHHRSSPSETSHQGPLEILRDLWIEFSESMHLDGKFQSLFSLLTEIQHFLRL